VVAQPDERYANRTASVLEWYDKHRVNNIWLKQRRSTVLSENNQFTVRQSFTLLTPLTSKRLQSSQLRTAAAPGHHPSSAKLNPEILADDG